MLLIFHLTYFNKFIIVDEWTDDWSSNYYLGLWFYNRLHDRLLWMKWLWWKSTRGDGVSKYIQKKYKRSFLLNEYTVPPIIHFVKTRNRFNHSILHKSSFYYNMCCSKTYKINWWKFFFWNTRFMFEFVATLRTKPMHFSDFQSIVTWNRYLASMQNMSNNL